MFRFLHAADLHLDSPLRGLDRYEGAPADRIRSATREAFDRLVDAAVEHEVAFVVLAGDLFDGDWRDYNSGLWFASRLRDLKRKDIRVVILRGNHDAASRVSKKLHPLDNVHEFSDRRAHTIEFEDLEVAFHGQSFAHAELTENIVVDYPKALDGRFNIGVLHTALGGREGHDNYAPCSLEDLKSKNYDYWALGHVHQRSVECEEPWVIFPGNIQGRHVRETGPKGATLVTVENRRVTRVEALELDVLRWDRVEVDLATVATEEDLLGAVREVVEKAARGLEDRLLAVRIQLCGNSALHETLLLHRERLDAELRNVAADTPNAVVWVEKILFQTRPISKDEDETHALGRLTRMIESRPLSDAFLQDAARQLKRLQGQLPKAAQERVDLTNLETLGEAASEAKTWLAALLAEGARGDEREIDEATT